MYVSEHDNEWPVWPVSINEGRDSVRFNSWDAFGATTSDFWEGRSSERLAMEGPVNPYVHPDVELFDDSEAEERIELPAFECPGDDATFQRSFWYTGEPDYSVTGYEDIGTSYHLNVAWWYEYEDRFPGEGEIARWERTKPMFRRAMLRKSSTFVWLFDQKFDIIAITGAEVEGFHGGMNKATGAFMDGHCGYMKVRPGEPYTDEYQILFQRPTEEGAGENQP